MPRVLRTVTTIVDGYPTLPVVANSLDIPFSAADATNKEEVVWVDGLIILVRNSGAGARTFTITSVALNGRTGDLGPYSLGAGEYAAIEVPASGFRQSNGKIYFEGEHAEVLFATVKA